MNQERLLLPLRAALRNASAFPVGVGCINECINFDEESDAVFARARRDGLASINPARRIGLARVTGDVAECVAQLFFAKIGYEIFWQITTPGVRGVDLLLLSPDEQVLALEVKGTLRPGGIPRLTPSRLRQMSRAWLSDRRNPGMAEWSLTTEDLYAGVAVVDLARDECRLALSNDFDRYLPVRDLADLGSLGSLGH